MVPFTGPVKVACTPLTAIAGVVISAILAVTEVAGHPKGQGCPFVDPHALTCSDERATAASNAVRMVGERMSPRIRNNRTSPQKASCQAFHPCSRLRGNGGSRQSDQGRPPGIENLMRGNAGCGAIAPLISRQGKSGLFVSVLWSEIADGDANARKGPGGIRPVPCR